MSLRLSVLIDTYNHEKYIEPAIRSVLAQERINLSELEIIVVDDGSTDRTGEIVQSYGCKLRYYRKSNGGQASAFNLGLSLCQGDILCLLDGDDWWHPNKLSAVMEAFERNPTVCAVGHSFMEVDQLGGNSWRVGPSDQIRFSFAAPNSIALFQEFCCCLGTSRLAMKRSTALALLSIPETLVFEADEYMFTLLPAMGEIMILPDTLTYYRIHGANLYHSSRVRPAKHTTDAGLSRRASIYQCLRDQLPKELARRGCSASLISRLLGPVEIQASRLKLMTSGGTPLENFRSERRAAELERRRTLLRTVVLWISLALSLLLPPRWYFGVKQSYANYLQRRNLRM